MSDPTKDSNKDSSKAKKGKTDQSSREDLVSEVHELQERIQTLEDMVTKLFEPLSQMRDATDGYLRLMDLYMRFGRISPEVILPGLKDDISKVIVQVLFERNGQNISQIADGVKAKRGTASRRIVRDRLKELESKGVVERRPRGKTTYYFISEEVVRKWSRMLAVNK